LFKEIINLISVTKGKDSDGFPIDIEHSHKAFADKKSVTRSEFYSSLQAGVNATAVFDVWQVDFDESAYDGAEATRLEHNGKKYKILRTYSKDGEMLEITCTDLGV
jgi:hypothetical protein